VTAEALRRERSRRRRLSSGCFLVAGVGFGTAFHLLRSRFAQLAAPGQAASFVALLLLTIGAFWVGARAEAEIGRLDEQLRELEERARRRG
jgi:hypothetical protein